MRSSLMSTDQYILGINGLIYFLLIKLFNSVFIYLKDTSRELDTFEDNLD